jgi:hypothetical protein
VVDERVSGVAVLSRLCRGQGGAVTCSGNWSTGRNRLWARPQGRLATSPRGALAAVLIWTRVRGIVSLELTGVFGDRTVEAQRLTDVEVDNAIHTMTGA